METVRNSAVMLVLAVVLSACSSVRVASDYDQEVDFNQYQTFAFFKPGIDQAEISDLDKKRILRAIETQLEAKGFTKSEDPDLLVSIFTTARQQVNVYNNSWGYGYGWRWSPYYYGSGYSSVHTNTDGTLYIDLVDAQEQELVWQGMGTASLATDVERKQKRINEIVQEILETYPPQRK